MSGTLDEKTIRALIREARRKMRAADRRFEETDSFDFMDERDAWSAAESWLKSKLDVK